MNSTRRAFLGCLQGAAAAAIAGCTGAEEPATTVTDDRPTATATPIESETSTTATRTEPPTTTEREPRAVLPKPTGAWTLTETEQTSSSIYGGDPGAGIAGWYEGPDGTRFQTVAIRFREPLTPDHLAESWACIDYDVAVAYEQWGFATGTGTEQQTFTPEAPPHLQRSPVPGTSERSRDLLARSPILTPALIDEHEVTCQYEP